MRINKKRKAYEFTSQKQSGDAMIASALAIVGIVTILIALFCTIKKNGQAWNILGLLCISTFLLSITGIVFAIISWKDEDARNGLKRFGTIANAAVIVTNVLLFILGLKG